MAKRPDHDAQWPWFVEWSLWTLGRGGYAAFGPRNRSLRPKSAPTPVPRRAHRILRELRKPDTVTRVTARSPLLAPPRATKARVAGYVVDRPHFPRTDEEARLIAELYHEIASSGGLDPVLVTAQMVLETGNLRSRWSQPPHRNMAGIGVTSNEMDPDDVPKFRSWKAAVTGHVGRLLAYALPLGEENATQRKLIEKALEARPLDNSKRGIARSPHGLTGTWATDPNYATSIVRVANEILQG
jgi:Mannosyl-glycoprotein endo-beta-N-acetylglucosaminidase